MILKVDNYVELKRFVVEILREHQNESQLTETLSSMQWSVANGVANFLLHIRLSHHVRPLVSMTAERETVESFLAIDLVKVFNCKTIFCFGDAPSSNDNFVFLHNDYPFACHQDRGQ